MTLLSYIILILQELPPLAQAAQKSGLREAVEIIGSIATPVAAIGLLVAIAYFFWHSKNREELTKAVAESTSLAVTRGERIKDLEKTIAERDALLLRKDLEIQEMELDDEKRARVEFRLRGEIADLERRLQINHDFND